MKYKKGDKLVLTGRQIVAQSLGHKIIQGMIDKGHCIISEVHDHTIDQRHVIVSVVEAPEFIIYPDMK